MGMSIGQTSLRVNAIAAGIKPRESSASTDIPMMGTPDSALTNKQTAAIPGQKNAQQQVQRAGFGKNTITVQSAAAKVVGKNVENAQRMIPTTEQNIEQKLIQQAEKKAQAEQQTTAQSTSVAPAETTGNTSAVQAVSPDQSTQSSANSTTNQSPRFDQSSLPNQSGVATAAYQAVGTRLDLRA